MEWITTAAAETAPQAPSWLQTLAAGAVGGLAVKAVDLTYIEWRRRGTQRETVEEFVQARLDPVLKAADELVGKMHSLAKEDFQSIPSSVSRSDRGDDNVEVTNAAYLIAQFWCAIEILRRESVYVRLSSSPSGEKLMAFLRCLEARRTRVLDRARQRAIGESLIVVGPEQLRPMGYAEFMTALLRERELVEWLRPLFDLIVATQHSSRRDQGPARQRLLRYTTILHAMIDTLDAEHTTTKDRPPQANKLSARTREDLRGRVFPLYLRFVARPERYWAPPGPRKGKWRPRTRR